MKEKYKIEFQNTVGSNGSVFYYADNATIDNAELAHHLVCCSKMATEQQIKDMEIALQGGIIQEDWGEIRALPCIFTHQKATCRLAIRLPKSL